jgi:ribonuclease HII
MDTPRPTVEECRRLLCTAPVKSLPRLIKLHRDDTRSGVASAVESASKRLAKHRAEERRLTSLMKRQIELHEQGIAVVAGCDEVGVGCLAGPVSAGAVVLSADTRIPGLDDSKRVLPHVRLELAEQVKEAATCWSVAHVSSLEIDSMGIWAAISEAMRRALAGLDITPEHVLVDGLRRDIGFPATCVVKGDSSIAAIAAASIVAKVERDALMVAYAEEHPGYGWEHNKGYRSREHWAAIDKLGPSPLHRMTYASLGQPELPFDEPM